MLRRQLAICCDRGGWMVRFDRHTDRVVGSIDALCEAVW